VTAQDSDSTDALNESRGVLATHYDLRDVKVDKVLSEHSTHIFIVSERGRFVLSASVPDGQRPPFLYQFAAVRALRHHGSNYAALPAVTRRAARTSSSTTAVDAQAVH
jgi:hypothetical protein